MQTLHHFVVVRLQHVRGHVVLRQALAAHSAADRRRDRLFWSFWRLCVAVVLAMRKRHVKFEQLPLLVEELATSQLRTAIRFHLKIETHRAVNISTNSYRIVIQNYSLQLKGEVCKKLHQVR